MMKPPYSNTNTNANANAYLRTKVMTASPAELRLMLFDGAIRYAEQAKAGLTNRDYEAAYLGITRCQNILLELINALRPEHDPVLCEKLSALYTFMYTHLIKASSERNSALVDEVIQLLQYERETWSMLLERVAAENRSATQRMSEAPETSAAASASDNAPRPPADSLVGATVSLRG